MVLSIRNACGTTCNHAANINRVSIGCVLCCIVWRPFWTFKWNVNCVFVLYTSYGSKSGGYSFCNLCNIFHCRMIELLTGFAFHWIDVSCVSCPLHT